MNNIEILEKGIKKMIEDERIHDDYRNMLTAIENLIQENKELKEALRSEIQAFNKMKELAETIRKENVEYIIQNRQYELHYIPKSKVKEIIYPTPENPIPFEVQSSEMYKKLEKLVEGE